MYVNSGSRVIDEVITPMWSVQTETQMMLTATTTTKSHADPILLWNGVASLQTHARTHIHLHAHTHKHKDTHGVIVSYNAHKLAA